MNQHGTDLAARPMTVTWLVLLVATAVGWWLGAGTASGASLAIAGVLVVAFAKVWLVAFQFMELRTAPRWLRHVFEVWIVGVCVVLLIICEF